MKINKIIIFQLTYFSALIAIFILAILPSEKLIDSFKLSDIFNHFAAFTTLSILFRLSFFKTKHITLFFCLTLYGTAIEATQYFLPWRSCSLKDLIVDISAITIFILIEKSYIWRKR